MIFKFGWRTYISIDSKATANISILVTLSVCIYPAQQLAETAQLQDHEFAPTYGNDLPAELWIRVLVEACLGEPKEVKSNLLKTLRRCSKASRQACNFCTNGLRLRNTHINVSVSAQLKTMINLVAVTVMVDCARTLCRDLKLLAGIFPDVSSLTLTPAINACMDDGFSITEMSKILEPWCHSLLSLQIDRCHIFYGATRSKWGDGCFCFGGGRFITTEWVQDAWCPDLPCVRSITLNHCTTTYINLKQCPKLLTLDMYKTHLCFGIGFYGATELRDVISTGDHAVYKLDLRGCSKLKAINCDCGELLAPPGLRVLREHSWDGGANYRS